MKGLKSHWDILKLAIDFLLAFEVCVTLFPTRQQRSTFLCKDVTKTKGKLDLRERLYVDDVDESEEEGQSVLNPGHIRQQRALWKYFHHWMRKNDPSDLAYTKPKLKGCFDKFTFDVFSLTLKAVQRQNDAAHQHVGVHQRAVDLSQESLELIKEVKVTTIYNTFLNEKQENTSPQNTLWRKQEKKTFLQSKTHQTVLSCSTDSADVFIM